MPASHESVADRGQIARTRLLLNRQMISEPSQRLSQSLRGLRRHRQQIRRSSRLRLQRHPISPSRPTRLKNHMRIRATETKRAHPTTTRRPTRLRRPRPQLPVQEERTLLPPDIVAQLLTIDTRRNTLPLHRHGQRHHTHQARSRLSMPHIRLRRSQRAKTRLLRMLPKRLHQRVNLDRIAQPGTRTMSHQIAHRPRRHPSTPINLPQQTNLRRTAGRGNPVRLPVVIDPAAQHRGINTVPIPLRSRPGLQHQHRNRLTRHHAIRPPVKRPAHTTLGQHPSLRHSVITAGVGEDVGAGDDGGVAVAITQAQARLMQRHQTRRTGGVDRHARAGQVHEVRQPRGKY